MNPAEWAPIAATMVKRWPAVDWAAWRDTGALAMYGQDLADLDARQVSVTMDVLAREGREWPPPAGQVRQKLLELTIDAPDWGQVKVWLTPTGGPTFSQSDQDCARGLCGGSTWVLDEETGEASECPCRAETIAAARGASHPLVARFVSELGAAELHDLPGDRTAEAQVRQKWEAFVRRVAQDERVRDLPTAGLPALERRARTPLQLDVKTALGLIEGGRESA